MTTQVTFKALSDGRVVRKTIPIEHPDFHVIPSEVFLGYELPAQSISTQVIDYLDSVDKSDIMERYGFDIILDYYIKKPRKRTERADEVAAFIEYMRPLVESRPDLQMPIEAVIRMAKDELFGCRKSNLQKAKEVLKMAEMSYCAAIGAYRNIGRIFDDCEQKMIE
jgi:hypothetical protein